VVVAGLVKMSVHSIQYYGFITVCTRCWAVYWRCWIHTCHLHQFYQLISCYPSAPFLTPQITPEFAAFLILCTVSLTASKKSHFTFITVLFKWTVSFCTTLKYTSFVQSPSWALNIPTAIWKIRRFYAVWRFISMSARACCWPISSARCTHFILKRLSVWSIRVRGLCSIL